MNGSDIIAYGWDWVTENNPNPAFPVAWEISSKSLPDYAVESMLAHNEKNERVFFKLRNGQIIRVKKKEGK